MELIFEYSCPRQFVPTNGLSSVSGAPYVLPGLRCLGTITEALCRSCINLGGVYVAASRGLPISTDS